jgi:peptidoglycan/xylan/chitin deacetylase (PgdA/CDA1 family)
VRTQLEERKDTAYLRAELTPETAHLKSPSILLYHKIDNRFEWGGTWVTPSQFRKQLSFLLEREYRFLGLEDLLRDTSSNSRVASVTFDDGYAALKDHAFPILYELGIPASVFIVTAYVGKSNLWDINVGWKRFDHLDWTHIKEAAARGVSFYSHTHTHRDLTRLSWNELLRELTVSREIIGERLGSRVPFVSYPFGIYNATVARAAAEVGYEAAFTLFRNGKQNVESRYCIERTAIYRIDTPGSIRRRFEGGPGAPLEKIKGRAINWFARGTPVAKRLLGRRAIAGGNQ